MTRLGTVILILLPVVVGVWGNIAFTQQLESYRHTPGFSGYSLSDWQEILNALTKGNLTPSEAQMAASLIGSLANQSSQSQPIGSASNASLNALYEYFTLSSGNFGETDIMNAISLLNNSNIRDLLYSMFTGRNVSSSDIMQALNLLNDMWRGGEISTTDYMLALKLLSILAQSQGYTDLSGRLDYESMKVAASLMNNLTSILQNLIPYTSQNYPAPTGVGLGAPPQLFLPSLKYLSVPQGLQTTIVTILVVAAAILLFFLAPRVAVKARSLNLLAYKRLERLLAEAGRWGEAVRLYWRAVSRVESSTGRRMLPSETHREYYNAVEASMGPSSALFKRLTEIYEARRFAGDSRRELDDEARRLYGELSGKL
uniref:DUF4129 domain-containing protein n=1 Tax=Thermogladius calderae TaxID=1200300 RepID=A0A7J3Y0W4_9CREN